MTANAPEPSNSEGKRDPEALRIALFDEIGTIEDLLQPLQGKESESIGLELAEKTRRLESFSENDLTSSKLPFLQKEIAKIKKKAQELANTPLLATRSQLLTQIANIEDTLRPLTAAESEAQDDARQKLKTDAATLQTDVGTTKQQLERLSSSELSPVKSELQQAVAAQQQKADALAIHSFLLNEFRDIDKILGSAQVSLLKSGELDFLKAETARRQKQLESLPNEDLFDFRRDVRKLRDRAEAVDLRQGFFAWLRSISILFWLGLIPFILFIYMTYYSWWQHHDRELIHQVSTAYAASHPSPTMPATETPAPVEPASAAAGTPGTQYP